MTNSEHTITNQMKEMAESSIYNIVISDEKNVYTDLIRFADCQQIKNSYRLKELKEKLRAELEEESRAEFEELVFKIKLELESRKYENSYFSICVILLFLIILIIALIKLINKSSV